MAEVRRATLADLEALYALLLDLHVESPEYRHEVVEPQVLRRWLRERIQGDLLVDYDVVFVGIADGQIVGFLFATICDQWFNSTRYALERLLYIRPERRGGPWLLRLTAAYETWARRHGASFAALGVSTGIHPDRTVHAYARLGYTLDKGRIVAKNL